MFINFHRSPLIIKNFDHKDYEFFKFNDYLKIYHFE